MSRFVRSIVATVAVAAALALSGCGPRVPDVVGKPLRQANFALVKAGFTPGDVRYDPDFAAPRGTVVSQKPRAGAFARAGATVVVTVAGSAPKAVPNVIGMTRSEALAALAAANLMCGGVTERFDDVIGYGRVVEQSIEPGGETRNGGSVELVLSLGPEGGAGAVPGGGSSATSATAGTKPRTGVGAAGGSGTGGSGASATGGAAGGATGGGTGGSGGSGAGGGTGGTGATGGGASGGGGTSGGTGTGGTGGTSGGGTGDTGTGGTSTGGTSGGTWGGLPTAPTAPAYENAGLSKAAVFKSWEIDPKTGQATDLCRITVAGIAVRAYCPFVGLSAGQKIYAVKRSDGLWIVTAIR